MERSTITAVEQPNSKIIYFDNNGDYDAIMVAGMSSEECETFIQSCFPKARILSVHIRAECYPSVLSPGHA
jgi:hypothetical protein